MDERYTGRIIQEAVWIAMQTAARAVGLEVALPADALLEGTMRHVCACGSTDIYRIAEALVRYVQSPTGEWILDVESIDPCDWNASGCLRCPSDTSNPVLLMRLTAAGRWVEV